MRLYKERIGAMQENIRIDSKMQKERNIWLEGIMGVIVGDALGMPVQFLKREEVAKNPVTTMTGFGTYNMPVGTWSDDGSMTLATLDSIIEKQSVDLPDIMEKFVLWLYRGEYTPFGKAFDEGLTCTYAISEYAKTKDVTTCGKTGEYANGNGSLMRIMPVCLYAYSRLKCGELQEKEAVESIHQASALTHNHLRAKLACGIYFYFIKAILEKEGSLIEMLQAGMDDAIRFYHRDAEALVELSHYERLFHLKEFAQADADEIRSSGYVVDSLEAAVWSLITTDNYKDSALRAVNLGDDTDTIGAIACGLAALYYGYEAIPEEWLVVIQKREWVEDLCGWGARILNLDLM